MPSFLNTPQSAAASAWGPASASGVAWVSDVSSVRRTWRRLRLPSVTKKAATAKTVIFTSVPIQSGRFSSGSQPNIGSKRSISGTQEPALVSRTKEDYIDALPTKTVHSGLGIASPDSLVKPFDQRLSNEMPAAQLAAYDRMLQMHRAWTVGALETIQRLKNVSLHPVPLSESGAAWAPNLSVRVLGMVQVLNYMSPLAVGGGLTVVGANYTIHLEDHWNPTKEAQPTDRIYCTGQTPS